MSEHIKTAQCDGVLEIHLSRPEKKNALSQVMYLALVNVLQAADDNADVRVVLLLGEGESFTSGNDLADFAASNVLSAPDNPVLRFIDVFGRFSKPLIVVVQGDVVGIGTTLLMHSDLVYAEPNARFSLPFVKLGLCPEFASAYLLPRLAGHMKAFEWLVLGEPFDAKQALHFGLINKMAENALALAREKAAFIAKLPPSAVCEAKRLMKLSTETRTNDIIKEEIESFSKALQGAEFAEAVSAFFEKRQPNFSSINKEA